MYQFVKCAGLLFLLVCHNLSAQDFSIEKKEPNLWNNFTYDMGSVVGGVGFAYSRPLHWNKNDLLILGGVVGGTAGFYLIDDNIRKTLLDHKERVNPIILDYGWYAGSPQNNYGLTGAIYLTGLFTKNEKLRRTGVLLISSATAAGVIQQITKSLLGRARPGAGFGKNHFKPFGGSAAYRSFPSGHSVLTFTNAYTIAKQFENPWVKGGIYAVGLIPGISRIYDDAHWASDVVLSWAMSAFIVEAIDKYLDRRYDKKYNNRNRNIEQNVDWSLTFGGNTLGVVVQF